VRENEKTIVENLCPYERPLPEAFEFESICDIYAHILGRFRFAESVKNGTYNGPWTVSVVIVNVSYDTQSHSPKELNFSVGYVEDVIGGPGHTLTVSEFKTLD
jgi:hypothetical protein